jgi:hypothetical protein
VHAASPYSTGGGGVRLEHRLGALWLVWLLTSKAAGVLGERPPETVAFQQSPATTVDDIVVTAAASDGVSSVRVEIAVRRTPRFIKSDAKTAKLIEALVRADVDAERAPDTAVERRLAIAVAGHRNDAHELSQLASVARGQSTAEGFFELVRTPGKYQSSGRLAHIIDLVTKALVEIDDDTIGDPEYRCWRLLRRLWVMQLELELPRDDGWTELIGDLKPVALGNSLEAAIELRGRIEQLAGESAAQAAVFDAMTLRRRLHGQIAAGAHTRPTGWARLVELDQQARATARRAIATGSTELVMPRKERQDALNEAIRTNNDLVVVGDSGVGKSALVMEAIRPERLGADRQALAVQLRELPSTHAELLASLIDPMATLFGELTAPRRMLVIDAAESIAEQRGEVFSYLVRAAKESGFQVVAVSTTEGAGAVSQLMDVVAAGVKRHDVPGFDDAELAVVAKRVPALKRLVDNPRARELLRRPIVIDLLCRAGDPGLPLSEAQALEHVWHHLVRNRGNPDGGAPDAREQVMLRLASHAVGRLDTDEVLERLDFGAVDGLRRSGLLLPASRMPWGLVPSFQHDLLRAYSVARLLLTDRNPADALQAIGPPRWTLPSARLACEITLAAPEEPSLPSAGRFASLQAGFDAIALGEAGERWSDVPTEALLMSLEAGALLTDAWPLLLENDAHGLRRIIRVLHGRHQRDGILDAVIAEPVVAQLLDAGTPASLDDEAGELVRDWLRALVVSHAPSDHPIRVALRTRIVERCAAIERDLDEKEADRQAKLAARTPEQIAAEEARHSEFDVMRQLSLGGRRRQRKKSARHRTYQWIGDARIEQLALLGPDLGHDGEAILRRIAEDEPQSLDHAVEPLLAGQSLALYDPRLLIDLAAAYYIEEDEDGHAWSSRLLDHGIRDHRRSGGFGPLASFTHGPFIALFRADYRGGVSLLNRMLDHGAQYRIKTLSGLHDPQSAPENSSAALLSITGEPREYVGDGHVWLWYRGTGVGPYPCMSALQALEFVTEEFINAGVKPAQLTAIMLDGACNLAMPALALGVLVRHLEAAGTAIDPFLSEPAVWELEFSRATSEHGGLAAQVPNLANAVRRTWTLREVGMLLALRADDERTALLKAVGERLKANAYEQIVDSSAPGVQEHLAAVRGWAGSLDRDNFKITEQDGYLVAEQLPDAAVEEVLGPPNADLRRTNDAYGLLGRHAHVRETGGRAPVIDNETLATDIALARDLLQSPPATAGFAMDGPVATAASAVELHLTSQATVTDDDLLWSASLLLQMAYDIAQREAEEYEDSFYDQGPDRSAARALPFLLLPAASKLRTALSITKSAEIDELVALMRAVAVTGVNETRMAYARALDFVWRTPCETAHLYGRCHHEIAFALVTESYLDVRLGTWDPNGQRRVPARLDPPRATTLDEIEGNDLRIQHLTAPIRALGSAATSDACCASEAQHALPSLLAAHQRAMTAHDHGHLHSDSDSMVAARAAVLQAVRGNDDVLLGYVVGYIGRPQALAEALRVIGAAAEERSELGGHVRRLWPAIMDLVLDAADADPRVFTEHPWGEYVEAALIPNSTALSPPLTHELVGDPYQWRDLLAWALHVERWLATITRARMSIDQLTIAVRELDVADQIEQGLRWIEAVVTGSGENCASTYTLPEWLRERRADLTTEDQVARWQRIVDLLVVAGDTRVSDLAD